MRKEDERESPYPWFFPEKPTSYDEPVKLAEAALVKRQVKVVETYLDQYPDRVRSYQREVRQLYRMSAVADTETLESVIEDSSTFDPGIIERTSYDTWIEANIEAGHTPHELARRDAVRYMHDDRLRSLYNEYPLRELGWTVDVASAVSSSLAIIGKLAQQADVLSPENAVTREDIHSLERRIYGDKKGYIQQQGQMTELSENALYRIAEAMADMECRLEDNPEQILLLGDGISDARDRLFAPLRTAWADELYSQ